MSILKCNVCFHECRLEEGQVGMCRTRYNKNGVSTSYNYGCITSLALDPIEKKPLYHYFPGNYIISVGSFGCNLACPFCQNATISMVNKETARYQYLSAKELAKIVLQHEDSIGIAFTYNEPLISYEYIIDVAKLIKPFDKKVVVVSNGCINDEILKQLLPYIDAANIDLKGNEAFYKEIGGCLKDVKNTIQTFVEYGIHVEVTTLVIPTKNDSIAFIEDVSQWLSLLDDDIVLHLSRYFPMYHSTIQVTPVDTLYTLQKVAKKYLKYVYVGNV